MKKILITGLVSFLTIFGMQAFTIENISTTPDTGHDDGTVTVTTSGTIGQVQYELRPQFQGFRVNINFDGKFTEIRGGKYELLVKDEAPSGESIPLQRAVEVGGPSLKITLVDSNDAKCVDSTDGNATFTIEGGVQNPGANPYTVSVEKGGVEQSLTPSITTGLQSTYAFTQLAGGSYVLKVQDANASSATFSFSIGAPTVAPTLSIVSNKAAVCNDNGIVEVALSTGGVSYSKDNFMTEQPEATFNNLAKGDYTLYGKDANGCVGSTSVTVGDNPIYIVLNGAKNSDCSSPLNGMLEFVVAGGDHLDGENHYSVQLLNNGSTEGTGTMEFVNSPGGSTTYTYSNLGAGSYTFKVTDKGNCDFTASRSLTAPAPLTLPSVESRDAVCDNGYIKVTDAPAVTGGTTPYQYSIDNFATLQLEKEFADLSAGSYNFGVQDAHGCQISQPDPIVIGSRPLQWVDQKAENTTCSDKQDGRYTCTIKGGFKVDQPDGRHTITMTKDGQPYDYLDDFTFQVISATNNEINYVFRNLPAGAYNVNFTDATGCSLGASFKINPAPAIVITETNNIAVTCKGLDNGAAEFNITGGTGGIDVNPADPASFPGQITIAQPVVQITNLPAGTYAMVANDMNNCLATFNVTIDEPEEELTYAPNTGASACGGLTGGQIFGVAAGGTPDYSYTATAVDFPYTDTNTTGTFEGLEPGAYDVVATDANGCTANATVQVRVLSIAPLTANPAANVVCPEQKTASVAFTVIGRTQAVAPADTASYYQVKLFNITQQHEVLAPDLKFSNKFHAVIYKYWTTQEPTLDEEGNPTFDEEGNPITHPVKHRAIDFDKGCHEVTKETEIENYTPDKKGFSCDDKVTLTGLGAGAYRAEIYQGACMIGEPIEFTVGVTGSLPQVQINDVPNFCDGSSYTIAPTITAVPGVTTYKWTLNGEEIAKTKELKRSYTADEDGQLLQVEVKNACGSAVSNQVKLTVRERPTATLALNKSYICAANPVLVSIAFKGTAPFTYELGNEGAVETQDALVQKEYIPTQTTTYELTSLKDAYCTADVLVDADTVQVDVYPEPEYIMDIDVPNPMINGRYVTITATPGFASYSLKMDGEPVPFATADSSNVFHTKQFNYGNGTYQFDLEITDANGCVWTLTENQDIESKIFPNIFTPNGDGVNDIFLAGYNLQVFNRWGALLYEGNTGWDGTHNGHQASEGVYLYTVEIESTDGEPVVLHATLTLER